MVRYDFRCHNCRTIFIKSMTFEEFDKNKDKKVKCVHCGKKTATRIILTSPKIEFKGDDFYINYSKKEEK